MIEFKLLLELFKLYVDKEKITQFQNIQIQNEKLQNMIPELFIYKYYKDRKRKRMNNQQNKNHQINKVPKIDPTESSSSSSKQ